MAILGRPFVRCIAIALLLGLVFGPVAIPYRILVLAGAAVLWTFLEARTLRPIGLGAHPIKKTLIWGVAIAVAVIAFGHAAQLLINRLFGVHSDLSAYGALAGNAQVALKLLSMALTSAAFGEEILFRGFLLYQLTAILGSGGRSRWISIVASGAAFGAAHFVQGPSGMVMTGLVGMVLGWAWFRSDRNLWALILAHALIDSFGIAMLYLGWSDF